VVDVVGVAVMPAATAAREELGRNAGVTVWLEAGPAVTVLLAGGEAEEGVATGGALALLWLLQGGMEIRLAGVSLGLSTSMGEDDIGGLAAVWLHRKWVEPVG